MDTLVCLASRAGKIVSADEMLDTVWHGRAHADNSVYQAVAHLRKALGDDARQPRYIETIPKKGYRLICPVTPAAADGEVPKSAIPSPSGWQPGRRNLAIFAGIASIAVAIMLTVNPELRDRLLPVDDSPRERSVAVLPFVDMSEDGNQQYLADGLAEELIHVLSNLPDLRVTARTSSFAFRDSNEDIRRIGRKLNVATILEGSVRKDGDRIRITSQLVDTRDGYHLWSKTFDRDASGLFGIQSEIAAAVAITFDYQNLDVLSIGERTARPDKLQTYDLYLLGLHQLHKQSQSGYTRAMEYFERAIESDPSFARAYAGLSESYVMASHLDDSELLKQAESAAEYALRLDDQSAEAFAALGLVRLRNGEYSGAEAVYVKAIELNPNDARSQGKLAFVYRRQGRVDEAVIMLQKALVLNPMSGELNMAMGQAEWMRTGWNWDSAFKYFERAMQRDPAHPGFYRTVGLYYYYTGQLDRAIRHINKFIDLTEPTDKPIKVSGSHVALADMYVDIGDYDSAAIIIREMREIEPDYFEVINAEIHLLLARRNFSAARSLVHSAASTQVGIDDVMSLLAFYEMVVGDTEHAEQIYAHLAAVPESPDMWGDVNLYRGTELSWGMLGAVNLAYLHNSDGEIEAARELLVEAREYMQPKNGPYFVRGIPYVLAQIAAVEGKNDAAIEYFRKAVDVG